MLGTPNMDSPCADLMDLAFGMVGKQVEAVRQLQQDYVEGFNKVHTQRKGVKFSALAGNPVPTVCKWSGAGDGVVQVPSAHWTIKDTGLSNSLHTDLTGTKDFSNFVKPHLAIGPNGNHNPETPEMPNRTGQNQNQFGAYFINASYRAPISSEASFAITIEKDYYKPDFAKAIKLSPKQSIEIEIPVRTAQNFGVTFMADSRVSATLFNDKGEILGKNLTKTPEANL